MLKPSLLSKLSLFNFALNIILLASGSQTMAAEALIKDTDTLSFSFRELSTSKTGTFKVQLVMRLCAGEKQIEASPNQSINCVELGRFNEESITGQGAELKIDVKKNSEKLTSASLQSINEKITSGLSQPVVRLSIQMFINGATTPAANEYVSFPATSKAADNERKILQEKVVLSGSGVRARVLVEIRRPQ
ncbi:MAG: hypothetical protein KA116_11015 [Proteobacteria bacterium]|nr:hypothetical protein [Pseudomonadota bacterium]